MTPLELAARKALLLAEAERERVALARAWNDVKLIVNPPRSVTRGMKVAPFTATVMRTMLPLIGFTRFGKLVRVLTIGLTAFRAVRGWR